MCVDMSNVLKGQQFMTFMVFLFFSNDRSLLLQYCASQAPPAFLSWVCILFCLLSLHFLFMEAWLAKFYLRCKMAMQYVKWQCISIDIFPHMCAIFSAK